MATKTIAGAPSPRNSPDEPAQDPADLLETTLTHLESLLWICYGEGIDWHTGDGPRHLDNVLWLAAEMARKAGEVFQGMEKGRREGAEAG